jgi:hypothetical protein
VQSRGAVIVSEPLPPFEPNDVGEALAETWHFDAVGAVDDVSEELQAKTASAATAAKGSAARATIGGIGCTRLASTAGKTFSQD